MTSRQKQKWVRRSIGILVLLIITSPLALCISHVWFPAKYMLSRIPSPDGKWLVEITEVIYESGPLGAGEYGNFIVTIQSSTGRFKEKVFESDDNSVQSPKIIWENNDHLNIVMHLMKERQMAFQATRYYGISISYDLDYRFK